MKVIRVAEMLWLTVAGTVCAVGIMPLTLAVPVPVAVAPLGSVIYTVTVRLPQGESLVPLTVKPIVSLPVIVPSGVVAIAPVNRRRVVASRGSRIKVGKAGHIAAPIPALLGIETGPGDIRQTGGVGQIIRAALAAIVSGG